jgi:hypothetical protein
MQSGTGEEFSIWADEGGGGRETCCLHSESIIPGGGREGGGEGPPADTECRSHAEPAKSKNIVNNITINTNIRGDSHVRVQYMG